MGPVIPPTAKGLLDQHRVEGYEHLYMVGHVYYRVRPLQNGKFRVDKREMGGSWKVDGYVYNTKDEAVDHIEAGIRRYIAYPNRGNTEV